MFQNVKKFLVSPIGKRLVAWVLPLLIAYVQHKFFREQKGSKGKIG